MYILCYRITDQNGGKNEREKKRRNKQVKKNIYIICTGKFKLIHF